MHAAALTDCLKQIPLFAKLCEEQIAHIAQLSQLEHLPRGGALFNQGETARGLCVLVCGQIKLGITSPQGTEKVMSIIQPGETFGEDFICLERPLPVYAQATLDSEVLVIPKKVILTLLDQDTLVAKKMIEGLSARMHRMFQDIERLSLQTSTERLVGYLLQISESEQHASDLTLPASKVTIASLLNLTPETLSRTMMKLQQAGLIEVYGKKVALDLHGLRAFA